MVFSTRKALSTRSTLAALTLLGIAALPHTAQAQANLTFSGGSGSPLTMTLTAPLNYTITSAASNAPLFVFQGVGNPFLTVGWSVTGTVTFSINGGVARTVTFINSGAARGNVAANDVYIAGSLPGVAVGDTVLLSAGALTTTSNIAAAAPANGAYSSFVASSTTALKISTFGSSAPEPGTLVLLALGMVGGVIARRRK